MDKRLDFLHSDAVTAAEQLLGCYLERELDGQKVRVKIVETEAYRQDDEASHSCRGMTERTKVMFGPAGHAYVYFTYGMHYCFNIVTGPSGYGAAVLIRAVEPVTGENVIMRRRNKAKSITQATNGPGKLCQALDITKLLWGHDLTKPPLVLLPGEPVAKKDIAKAPRIGISRAMHKPWRFYIKDNPFVSKIHYTKEA